MAWARQARGGRGLAPHPKPRLTVRPHEPVDARAVHIPPKARRESVVDACPRPPAVAGLCGGTAPAAMRHAPHRDQPLIGQQHRGRMALIKVRSPRGDNDIFRLVAGNVHEREPRRRPNTQNGEGANRCHSPRESLFSQAFHAANYTINHNLHAPHTQAAALCTMLVKMAGKLPAKSTSHPSTNSTSPTS